MNYIFGYKTPEGFDDIMMSSDGEFLTGLWFKGPRGAAEHVSGCVCTELPVFTETCRWLDIYFSGKDPGLKPQYKIEDLTPFRREVFEIMEKIPFGKTSTYGEIASVIAAKRGIPRMSAQAVGGAVGWNPVGIILPCHRVIGSGGNLTGYGGGMKNKIALLELEGCRGFLH